MKAFVRAVTGTLVFAFLLLALWFDHRGFLHGMAFMAQIWWLWSIRPRRSANMSLYGHLYSVFGVDVCRVYCICIKKWLYYGESAYVMYFHPRSVVSDQ